MVDDSLFAVDLRVDFPELEVETDQILILALHVILLGLAMLPHLHPLPQSHQHQLLLRDQQRLVEA